MANLNFAEQSTYYSPVADAEALRNACQGWGTDEKTIISILGRRSASQRELIREAYEELYQEDLVTRLQSELSGHFQKAVYAWMLAPEDRDAVLLHHAIMDKTPVIDYRVIVEISTIYSPDQLLAVKRAYHIRYKHSLEEDLAHHTTAHLRKLLVGLVSVYRYGGDDINARLATCEAFELHSAVKAKSLTHGDVVRIVTTRSRAQVLATLNHYKDEHGASITKHLIGYPSSDYLNALRIAIRCTTHHEKYYEKLIRQALAGSHDDDDWSSVTLTRVVVTRADEDLNQIKELFYKRNSVALDHAIARETSGHYKDFLLTLLGHHQDYII